MSAFQGAIALLFGGYLWYVAPDVAARLGGFVPERETGEADVWVVRIAGVVLMGLGAVLVALDVL